MTDNKILAYRKVPVMEPRPRTLKIFRGQGQGHLSRGQGQGHASRSQGQAHRSRTTGIFDFSMKSKNVVGDLVMK